MASRFEFFYGKGKPSMTTALELNYRLQIWSKNRDSHWLSQGTGDQEHELAWEEGGQSEVPMATFEGLP